ncbi:hypothetical protein QMK33_22545 [Hymenobacter sp. H14-R3]|uniref:hypothetical protein n=1 Tax=Hymenobacter sp. H14-R3 TaxID=3046308 RepID=UPI0024BADC81|nr:hypothetical protein [Hymenobacter sp. H14-R3]MDJ0367931.1 hypothetical protein [Hymenobacter sp. H14-R3]
MLLTAPLVPTTQECTITVETASLLGNLGYVNTRRTRFRKEPVRPAGEGWCYAVTVLDFHQTEEKGLAQLDADTAVLRRELLIETDASGALLRVCNKAELQRQWASLHPQLRKKYRYSKDIMPGMIDGIGQVLHGDGYLEDVLRRGYEYGTLFPALYGRHYTAVPAPGPPRTIARFLGDLDLPLNTTARQQEPVPGDVAYGVVVEGLVNQEEFPRQALRESLRTITDQLDLDTTLRLQHLESYELDRNAELRHAAQFTIYGVAGVFMNKNLCTLAPTPPAQS